MSPRTRTCGWLDAGPGSQSRSKWRQDSTPSRPDVPPPVPPGGRADAGAVRRPDGLQRPGPGWALPWLSLAPGPPVRGALSTQGHPARTLFGCHGGGSSTPRRHDRWSSGPARRPPPTYHLTAAPHSKLLPWRLEVTACRPCCRIPGRDTAGSEWAPSTVPASPPLPLVARPSVRRSPGARTSSAKGTSIAAAAPVCSPAPSLACQVPQWPGRGNTVGPGVREEARVVGGQPATSQYART